MTAFLRAYLHCNACGDFFRDETIPQDETIRQALRAAKRAGWTRRMCDGRWVDYCQDCTFGRERGDQGS